jgi:thymidylate synthase/dihydrofolate reductase
MNIVVIACVDSKFGISKDGDIPWNIQEDKDYFRNTISKHGEHPNIIVMGRKTFEKMGAVKNNISIIISKSLPEVIEGNVITLNNIERVEDIISSFKHEKVYICGGKSIYEYFQSKFLNITYLINQLNKDYECDNIIDLNFFDLSQEKWDIQLEVLDRSDNSMVTMTVYRDLKEEVNEEERSYLSLMYNLLSTPLVQTRNAQVYEGFGEILKFDLQNSFPLMTTKRMFFTGIFEELMFFIRGQTDTKLLSDKGVKIWEPNTSREFLDKCGLQYPEGQMGPMYGYNWRHFGLSFQEKGQISAILFQNSQMLASAAELLSKSAVALSSKSGSTFISTSSNLLATSSNLLSQSSTLISKSLPPEGGFDQLNYVINLLKTDPSSRRILMTTFDPSVASQGVLYPCHGLTIQFHTQKTLSGEYLLSVSQTQRSCDMFLGVPFNISSYALLVYLLCHIINNDEECLYKYIPGTLIMNLGNYHVYEQHFAQVRKQYLREVYDFPTLAIKGKILKIEDFKLEDIEISNYKCHMGIKAPMIE